MILFNKLVMTDLILVIAVLSLFLIKAAPVRDALLGFSSAVFVFSIVYHIRHYKSNKKFY
jgi:hypothetical protein